MNNEAYFRTDFARIHANRTRFHQPFDHLTTFNTGDIVPLVWEQIDPGDSIVDDYSYMLRLQTPIAPFMSRVFLDVYAFFIPNRIIWNHWEEFYGQNNTSAWTQSFEYTIPQCDIECDPEKSSGVVGVGSIGDYMGLPVSSTVECSVSDLPLRAYLMVYNDWFRDENIIAPVLFSKEDTHSSTMDYTSAPLKAAKFHDYFTSLLPAPQKGNPVELAGYMPVMVGDPHISKLGIPDPDDPTSWVSGAQYGMQWSNITGSALPSESRLLGFSKANNTSPAWTMYRATVDSQGGSGYVVPNNLWAELNITIETIRNAAVVQHVFEKMARFGSRYVESLRGLWGVTPSDSSLQIPEYLGGKRHQLSINDVVSTADTTNEAATSGEFLGQVGAYSKSKDGGHLTTKSFSEHGIYLVLGVVRVEQHYFQGLHRKWTNSKFFDFYLPELQNIGNQPVYQRELNCDGMFSDDPSWNTVLGYSEAWADKRYRVDQISGLLRPGVTGALGYYTASDVIDDEVSLSQDFIEQGASGIDRVLAVPSTMESSSQWLLNIHFDTYWTKRMDPHSDPGVYRI